jgi:hypothetical protein
MKTIVNILLGGISICLTSCLEEVQIPLRIESSVLVVDGGITNQSPPYSVRLSYSGNQDNSNDINQNLAVSGARVVLKSDTGDLPITKRVFTGHQTPNS